MNARFSLPPGEYSVELLPVGRGGMSGALALQLGRLGNTTVEWPVTASGNEIWRQAFAFRTEVNFVGFQASPELQRSVGELRLRPVHIVSESARVATFPVISAAMYGPTPVYFHDARIYPETRGFWVRGAATAAVSIGTMSSDGVTLRLHSGPEPNTVTLATSVWREHIQLSPATPVEIRVPALAIYSPVDPRADLIPLTITTDRGFVPAERDGRSADRRMLGCWVEIVG
jgi:hypothetical protein